MKEKNNLKLAITNYEITYEAIRNNHLEKLPWKIRETMEEAFYAIKNNSTDVIEKYNKLPDKYKDNPVLLNYLATAYSYSGDTEKAKKVILRNYEKNKKYLFSKINYAQICIEEKNYGKIHEIFEGKFELKLLYPRRGVFHIDEFLNFTWVMGVYFYNIEDIKQANIYLNMLKKVEPKSRHTKNLKKLLYPSVFRRWLLKKNSP